MVTNTTLVANRTPEMAPEVQESIEGVVEGTNKRKKNLGIDNENSPDREGKEAGERVKKLIKEMKESGEADEKEEGEIDHEEVQVKKNKNEATKIKLDRALKEGEIDHE